MVLFKFVKKNSCEVEVTREIVVGNIIVLLSDASLNKPIYNSLE
jgi:hypothetical protein